MADKKISALTSATTPLAGTEVLPIVQSGATVKVAVSDLTAGRAISATQLTLTAGNLIPANGYGVDFSATPGTGTSELFDDYEEGTWTPTYEPRDGAFTSITYASVFGFYTKIGNVVYISGQLATDAVTLGTAATELFIGNLPFGAVQPSVLSLAWSQDFNTGNPSALGVRGATLTNVRIFYRTSASGAALSIDPSFLANGVGKNYIQFAGCYIAS
jgi:hypothetical protein